MTPEQRLDRLERVAKLLIRAGLRERTKINENNEKINILITTQIKTEETMALSQQRFDERFARNEERFARTEQAIGRLVTAQARTDQKLRTLLDVIRRKES